MALCGDDADVRERIRHAVSVALMLVNTADFCATTSCLELVPGWMLCSGDGDGRWSAGKGAQNGDGGWSGPKAHNTDTPELSENSGARRE